jgi:hypothetical protein
MALDGTYSNKVLENKGGGSLGDVPQNRTLNNKN